MSRVTKEMLLEENRTLRSKNEFLRREISHLQELNTFLKSQHLDIEAFNRMHSQAMDSIAHVVTDLRMLITHKT